MRKIKRKPLLWQIFPSFVLVIALSAVLIGFTAGYLAKQYYIDRVYQQLETSANLVKELHASTSAESLSSKFEKIRKVSSKTQIQVSIISKKGQLLADSEEGSARFNDLTFVPDVKDAIAGKVGRYEGVGIKNDKKKLFLSIPAENQNEIIRVSLPSRQVYKSVHAIYLKILYTGILLIIVAGIIAKWISKKIAYPLEEIKVGAERFAKGDLGFRLYAPRNDEHGRLARVLNKMAAQLDERVAFIIRQKNELDAVLSSMREGVIAVDRDHKVIRMNHAASLIINVPEDKSKGKSIEEVLRNINLQNFVKRALLNEDSIEADIILHDASEKNIKAYSKLILDVHGRKIGVLVVLSDVTRILQLENIRTDFVANVSHELKTPITSIKGFVETLIDGAIDKPDEAKRFLGIIAKQADRLNQIFDDLLTIAKLEQDQESVEITKEPALIKDVLTNVQLACEIKAKNKDIKINIDCEAGLEGNVNSSLIEQALVNLVDNAIKYSDSNKTVHIKACRENGKLRFDVIDQGVGIDSNHLPRIFERFYRVDAARSRQQGGTGLGLSIVKHIAILHSGTAEVKSQVGEGSTFSLILQG